MSYVFTAWTYSELELSWAFSTVPIALSHIMSKVLRVIIGNIFCISPVAFGFITFSTKISLYFRKMSKYCSNILKWKAGVITFLRSNHFLSVLIKSPVPSHGSSKLYRLDLVRYFVLVRITFTYKCKVWDYKIEWTQINYTSTNFGSVIWNSSLLATQIRKIFPYFADSFLTNAK